MKKLSKEHKLPLLILWGAFLGTVATLTVMLLLSAAMLVFDLSRSMALPFATLSVAFGAFSAAFFIARKAERKGYIIGLCVGASVFTLISVIAFAVSKEPITQNTLFHFVIVMLSSIAGGILGVNLHKNKKYI